jgi:hypothetical protein
MEVDQEIILPSVRFGYSEQLYIILLVVERKFHKGNFNLPL